MSQLKVLGFFMAGNVFSPTNYYMKASCEMEESFELPGHIIGLCVNNDLLKIVCLLLSPSQ